MMFKKIKGHYSQNKRKVSKRDVISYEDMPLDDYDQEKTQISVNAVKKIIICICIAFVAGLIVFAFANREAFTWENIANWWTYDVLGNADNGYPVDIIGAEVTPGNFTVQQGHAVYASDTSFVTLNSAGSEVANIQLRHSNPIMKSNGNRFLTYGIGNADFQINSFDENLYTGEAEAKIFTADIASNGIYCLVTEGNGYLSILYVFDANNNRIYKYYFSDYYITSVSLNSSGTGCVACGLTSNKGEVKTGVYVLNFKKDKPVTLTEIPDDAILEGKYLKDSRAVLIGQQASYIIKIGKEDYITSSYNNKSLANYCINPEFNTYTLALSRSGDGRSVEIVSCNDSGEERYSFNTNNKADSLSVYKGTTALLDGNIAYSYNQKGELLYSDDTGAGSKKIILTSDNNAYILSSNQIRFIDFTRTSTDDTAGFANNTKEDN